MTEEKHEAGDGAESFLAGDTATEGFEDPADRPLTAGDFRNAGYVVAFLAAIFLINAMEPGSIGAPWPIGIVLVIAAAGLIGYSFYRQRHEGVLKNENFRPESRNSENEKAQHIQEM